MAETLEQTKPKYLTAKVQVGTAKTDKISFPQNQKVFHSSDVPTHVRECKKEAHRKRQPNILGTQPYKWNDSAIADPKIQKDVNKDLKRQLLTVRAGLMDELTLKPSQAHKPDKILENQRHIVAMTGQGPIGKLSGKWMNAVDERGLASHCIDEKWPDFNHSHSCHTQEDAKHAQKVFQASEARSKRMNDFNKLVNHSEYRPPHKASGRLNDQLRDMKVDYQDLKEQFKKELKVEFPNASEERLQAMAQRLLNEKLLADKKTSMFPVQHESFRPNLSLTTRSSRYKEYYHSGAWQYRELDKCWAWSCCGGGDKSKGCEMKIVNPDAWCTAGYERHSAR
jgi:hypothetical protein